jgi:hypothetical protein
VLIRILRNFNSLDTLSIVVTCAQSTNFFYMKLFAPQFSLSSLPVDKSFHFTAIFLFPLFHPSFSPSIAHCLHNALPLATPVLCPFRFPLSRLNSSLPCAPRRVAEQPPRRVAKNPHVFINFFIINLLFCWQYLIFVWNLDFFLGGKFIDVHYGILLEICFFLFWC